MHNVYIGYAYHAFTQADLTFWFLAEINTTGVGETTVLRAVCLESFLPSTLTHPDPAADRTA
jgi:hypothetical protein